MHVALVTETYPPEVNGVARTLWQLSKGLTDRGHVLDLVRPRQPEDSAGRSSEDTAWRTLLTGGYPIPFYPGLRVGLPAYRRLKARWRAERPDVVHIATEGPLGFSALRAARVLGIPISSSFHTHFHQYSKFYGYSALTQVAVGYLRWFHNRTGRTLVPTMDVSTLLAGQGFERLDILSRGVDTALFCPSRRSRELRREWGVEDDEPVALYVGRLAPEKSPELAIAAFKRLRAEVPGCRCVVVGGGPSEAAMRRQDPDAVFCGMRRGVDLAEHYASADFLIFSSQTETFGNVLLEAMASGLPVVSYDYAAAGLLVESEREGLTVPLGDERQWLTAVSKMASLPKGELRLMGEAARIRAELETWDRIVDRFVRVLNDLSAADPTGELEATATSGPAQLTEPSRPRLTKLSEAA